MTADQDGGRRLGVLVTPRLLAELLWLYGEDALSASALELTPSAIEFLSFECGRCYLHREELLRTWPGAPHEAYLVLPVIRYLSGQRRPPALSRRRPSDAIPTPIRTAAS